MAGEVEQRRVEADGVALAFQHGTFKIVVQNDTADPAEGLEGTDMAAQEVLHAGIKKEAHEDLPREAQDHDECHQGTTSLTDREVAHMGPVHLTFFSR